MVFIGKKEAFQLLDDMESGKCVERCRTVWIGHIRHALKSKTNPLKLTATEKKRMTRRFKEVKEAKRKEKKTRKNKKD